MDHRTGSPLIGEPSPRAVAIRDDIAQTRADMSRTVGAIEERLSPAHIKEQIADVKENLLDQINDAKDNLKADLKNEIREAKSAVRDATVGRVENMVSDVRDTVTDTGTSIVDTIRENPVPAALVAVGLGWLLMSGGSSRRVRRERRLVTGYDQDYRYAYERNRARGGVRRAIDTAEARVADVGQRAMEGASHLADEAGAVVHDVGERAAHLANDAATTGRRVIRDAGTSARRYEASLESTMRDNPLVVGAIAVAVGAAIGLALPSTEKEDELLGEAKDRLLEGAKSVAGEALHQVEAKVDELAAPPTSQNGHNGPSTARNGLGNGVGPSHV